MTGTALPEPRSRPWTCDPCLVTSPGHSVLVVPVPEIEPFARPDRREQLVRMIEIRAVEERIQKLFAEGRKIRVTKVPFSSNPKALINHDPRGFVKIVSDPATGVVLGGSIVGQHAAELISVIALAVTANLKVQDITESLFVHPALAEALADAQRRDPCNRRPRRRRVRAERERRAGPPQLRLLVERDRRAHAHDLSRVRLGRSST